MYYRPSLTSEDQDSSSSFAFHTWMIARLIEKSGNDNTFLSHYVIATCYERMITRMRYHVSISIRDAIKNLPQTFKFPGQSLLINASNLNDRNFITFLSKKRNHLKLRTPIDNLVKHENDLYNQETYVDFHSILCELLELYLKSLDELKDMHHHLKTKAPSTKQTLSKIDFIAVVGTLLRLLVKSVAIKRCFHSIVRFLPDRTAGVKAKVGNKTDDDDDDDEDDEREGDDEGDRLYRDEEEDEDELDRDDDSDVVERGSASLELHPKSQACLRSLNLGVIYFDAVLVLSHFVKKQTKPGIDIEQQDATKPVDFNINIEVLEIPCQSKDVRMLSWKTLLQHETYFPGKPSPSAKEIIEFLELRASSTGNQRSSQNTTDNQMSGRKSSKMSQKSKKIPVSTEVSPESVLGTLVGLRRDIHDLEEDTFNSKIDKAVSLISTLQFGDTSPGLTKYIGSIKNKLELAKGTYLNKLDLKDEIDEIMKMLGTLADNTRLERKLQEGSALDTGVGFKGSLHAEVCVAAHCKEAKWFEVSPPSQPEAVSYSIIMFCSDLLILLVVQVCYTSSRCIKILLSNLCVCAQEHRTSIHFHEHTQHHQSMFITFHSFFGSY